MVAWWSDEGEGRISSDGLLGCADSPSGGKSRSVATTYPVLRTVCYDDAAWRVNLGVQRDALTPASCVAF